MLFYNISNQNITDNNFNYIISQINGPKDTKGTEKIFYNDINNDKHSRRILAYATGIGFNSYNTTDSNTLEAFLNRFPNPFDFDEASEAFLANIRASNPLPKYQEYLKSMHNFKHAVYGKKQEYYEQVKLLQAEAAEKFPPTQYQNQVESINNPESIESLLETATFDNSPFIYHGQEYHLTTEHLKQANLEPRYELRMEGYRIGFSDSFKTNDRDACLGYVQSPDGKVTVRSYYRSNSAGVWRYLPNYISNDNGEIEWFGKGYGEESLTLPFEFQEKLNHIIENKPADLNGIMPSFIFAGTSHKIEPMNREEYRVEGKNGTLLGDFYREVNSDETYGFGQLSNHKAHPDSIEIYGESSPDFDRQLGTSTTQTLEYGTTTFKLFPSYNQKLRYTMSETTEDGERRAWLSGIEVSSSRLTSTGCRAAWASIGDVGTPLHEYRALSGGYGEGMNSKRYVNMWHNYLSRMPFIKRYLAATS